MGCIAGDAAAAAERKDEQPDEFFDRRVLKPPPDFGSSELRYVSGASSR